MKSILKVEKISCQKGYNLLFENLSFYLNKGDIARIVGKNGSGKTSLLKILAGINTADSGKVLLLDNKQNSFEYKQDVLYLGHQSLIAPQLNAIENLNFLLQLNGNYTNNLQNALESIGLKNYTNELCYRLSAGQKRKVILSTLFLSKAKLWLLDEPFIALDSETVKIIESLVNKHSNNGGVCILTTHQTSALNFKEINL